MPILVKKIRDIHTVEFDSGRIDDWCVYLKRHGQKRYAPTDTEYFLLLQKLAVIHSSKKIYNDFVLIYNPTNQNIDKAVLELITILSNSYGKDSVEMDIWFTVLYAGMIAEENKTNAVLKKRIKRLGMHQILKEHFEPGTAANFSKGKKWKELDVLMKEKGF
jgi:hypothetical protein